MYSTVSVGSAREFLARLSELEEGQHTLIVNEEHTTEKEFRTRLREAKGGVFDFDGTLHPGNQWQGKRGCMLPDLAQKDLEGAKKYLDITVENRTDYDDLDFVFRSIDHLIRSGYTRDMADACAAKLFPREGALELVSSFDGRSKIVSFGSSFIEHWCKHWGMNASVGALRLLWDDDGRLIGYDHRTVVSDGNKGFMYDAFRAKHRLAHEEVLVLGDSLTDIKMMRPEGLGILVLPKVDPDKMRASWREGTLERLWPQVTAVLASDSLEPLMHIRRS